MFVDRLVDILLEFRIFFFSAVAVLLASQTYVLPDPDLTKTHAQVIDYVSEIEGLDDALVRCNLSKRGEV